MSSQPASLTTMSLQLLVALFFLQIIIPASAQSIVDNERYCKKFGYSCGEPDSSNSQKYCCVQSNGGFPVYSCCNPYIGLFIGLGVGIPTIIGIIVLVVVLYCLCVRYQNRKMRVLIESYEREDNNTPQREETNFIAPPPYTPLRGEEEVDPDADLPPYCENDPFTGSTSPNSSERTASPAGNQSTPPPLPPPAAATNEETVEVELEDVPLISDDDEQQN